MHLLLGAANDQYARMYMKAMDVAKKLLFRPMMPQNPDILVPGVIRVIGPRNKQHFSAITSHLVCFRPNFSANYTDNV